MSGPVEIDAELVDGLEAFMAQRDEGPEPMTRTDAVNVIVRDWLMGQGFLPLPGEAPIIDALTAANVPGERR